MGRTAAVLLGLGLYLGAGFAAPAKAAKASNAGDPHKGKAVFEQCAVCHAANSTERKMGPGLKGLFKRQKLSNGQKVTEQTVRAKIDSGGNGMPPYREMLNEKQKNDLIAYLKTL